MARRVDGSVRPEEFLCDASHWRGMSARAYGSFPGDSASQTDPNSSLAGRPRAFGARAIRRESFTPPQSLTAVFRIRPRDRAHLALSAPEMN